MNLKTQNALKVIIAMIITSEILYLSVLYSKKFNPTIAESLIIVIVPFFLTAYVLFISKKHVLNVLFILLVLTNFQFIRTILTHLI